jgi:hypothetical protein
MRVTLEVTAVVSALGRSVQGLWRGMSGNVEQVKCQVRALDEGECQMAAWRGCRTGTTR